MATKNTDYLQFNAYSIKEMIIRKLSEDTKFTDQVYEGSNLNILIDLVSYMFQCLMYNLNTAAAESMFADTQFYENMNRLVKFLGYNPRGIIPSSGQFYIDNTNAKFADKYILKYSAIDVGATDDNGDTIYYSTSNDIHIDSTGENQTFKFNLKNGIWKLYPTVFTATGSDYESFDLPYIKSDFENGQHSNELVANEGIHVYVEHMQLTANGKYVPTFTQFNVIEQELFVNNDYDQNITSYARIYNRYDNIVNVRLNETKSYTIKFGNGLIGKKLSNGDRVYVFYFATNGKYANVTYDNYGMPKKLMHNASMFGISTEAYNAIFGNAEFAIASSGNDNEIDVYLADNTSNAIPEENVDQIRLSAPEWFKIGQRLITAADYEYYIKNLRKGEVIDAICQNNYEYASTFYAWLFNLGIINHKDAGGGKYYLNRSTLANFNYQLSDPVDINNVYIWIKMYDNATIQNLKTQYIEDIQKLKCLTSNVIFNDVIDVNFSVTAMPEDKIIEMLNNNTYIDNDQSYIEVTMNNNTVYASSVIAEQIHTIIQNFFLSDDIKIGCTVNYNKLVEKLYQVNGIERIRTIYLPNNDIKQLRVFEGISFATWSKQLIDVGDDLEVSNSSRSLEKFQYPLFFDANLQKRIKVIKKSINSGLRIQY